MFFNSNRINAQGNKRRERIWCSERIAAGWSEPFCLSGEINDEHLHWQVSVDVKGNLYFGSERTGTKGRDDVFFAGLVNGRWMKAVSMGREFDGACPYVSPDGKYIFFLKMGMRNDDIYWASTQIIEKLKPKD